MSNISFSKEKLYHGVCDNCKMEYTNIPESQTNMQHEGEYRFISCTRILQRKKGFYNKTYCGGFVELFLQEESLNDE